MALVDPLAPQQVVVHRDTSVSDEQLLEEIAKHVKQVKYRDSVGPRRTIIVTEADESSKTYRTGDKLFHGPGCIRSGIDWEALKRNKDRVSLTDSQLAVNNDLPEARYIIGEKALTTRTGIKGPREITGALDFARPPYPERREYIQGRWVEPGALDPGSDGTEKLNELLAKGAVVDRKLVDRVKSAAKRVLKGSKSSSKAAG